MNRFSMVFHKIVRILVKYKNITSKSWILSNIPQFNVFFLIFPLFLNRLGFLRNYPRINGVKVTPRHMNIPNIKSMIIKSLSLKLILVV